MAISGKYEQTCILFVSVCNSIFDYTISHYISLSLFFSCYLFLSLSLSRSLSLSPSLSFALSLYLYLTLSFSLSISLILSLTLSLSSIFFLFLPLKTDPIISNRLATIRPFLSIHVVHILLLGGSHNQRN